MPSNTRIVGLFPEFLAHGGVQEAGRQSAAALSEIAMSQGWSTQFLTLNDPKGEQSIDVGKRSVPYTGYHRAKVQFVLATLKATRNDARLLFAGHPNLAPPAALARRFSKRLKTIVVTHGIEVWTPLPPQRRSALLKADAILAPSSYTVQKLIEVQAVPAAKIQRLPWPLDPEFLKLAQSPAELPFRKTSRRTAAR